MKQMLEYLGVLLLIQGVVSLTSELTGRLHGWGVVHRIAIADGHELYLSIALIALAIAVFAAAESRRFG
ncbi:hypothetical protein GPA10_15795 [Streptomyces sp. p1417]|uniref:Uncharacterized protein n=1 Tax=Streptomyces typhae TaxID=2681492 RepID=A0A6L6WWJ3_9ACTN|nr:hypothetical protein [Streptomyces typhae]MVO86179.1 hypothetical protein [Streptomyces typhae]